MLDATYCVLRTFLGALPCFADALHGVDRPRFDVHIRSWAHDLVRRSGMRLTILGSQAIDWTRAYIVMSNHQSHFDIPVLFVCVPTSLRMVTKKELFRIPVFGQALRAIEMVRIDRGDRAQALASLRAAGALLEGGLSIWIAPEGTRSRDGRIGPLKKGGFILASETGVPILPVAIDGTRHVLPAESLTLHHDLPVRVTFGQPIPSKGATVEELTAKVQAFFAGTLHP